MPDDGDLTDETEMFDGEKDPWETVYLSNASAIGAERIGRYRQIRKLGEGEFGIVWLGFDEQLQRPVAIKIAKTATSSKLGRGSLEPVESQLREARHVALLDHPHIVPVYDVGITGEGHFFVVSKYVDGETLENLLQRRTLGVIESMRLVQSIAEALSHAHDKGLVHRDIKPANILIDFASGRPHVTDFGLSFHRRANQSTNGITGTPNYMSPEQIQGDIDAIDARSDLFSLGVILYELLTGRLPFQAKKLLELFDQILHSEPPRANDLVPDLDDELATICSRSIAKSKEARFASAADFAEAIHQCAQRLEGTATEAMGSNSVPVAGLLGEYRLLELIGTGGLGEVYRAEQRFLRRPVAVKLLHPKGEMKSGTMQRFLEEIRLVSKLSHPNIVAALDAGRESGRLYLVMELIEGESLAERLSRLGPLTTSEAVHALRQIALALDHAHSKNIIHRDIKPGNLMVDQDGTVKVLDFGLAILQSDASDTPSNNAPPNDASKSIRQRVGTPHFMSPEQAIGSSDLEARSDLYSLGATLFALLVGRPMFEGIEKNTATARASMAPPKLYEARPNIDLRIDSVYQRLVAKSPKDRYPSARALLDELDRLRLAESPIRRVANHVYLKGLFRNQPSSIHDLDRPADKECIALGIDFGLGSSTIAWCDAETDPQLISHPNGQGTQLRNMLWSIGEHVQIGAAAEALRQSRPQGIFHSIQRWIGLDLVKRPWAGRSVPPEVLIAALMHRLMSNARHIIPRAKQAVVTVPSCYDQIHRRSILTACEIAGIDVLQLLDKPLAVVLAWLTDLKKNDSTKSFDGEKLLVVHLGGTGLDASVIEVAGQEIRSLGTCGDWRCGSQRWIHLLTQHFSLELKQRTGLEIHSDVFAATRLQRTLEMAIHRLTTKPGVEVRFEWRGTQITKRLNPTSLLELVPSIEQEILKAISGACHSAGCEISAVRHVILAGMLMRLKPMQSIVEKLVPNTSSISVVDKEELSCGAAIQARALMRDEVAVPGRYRAIPCVIYDIAVPRMTAGQPLFQPIRLLARGTELPASIARSLRFEELAPSQLQLIEGPYFRDEVWTRLGKIELKDHFSVDGNRGAIKLRIDGDSSGIITAQLIALDTDQRIQMRLAGDRWTSQEITEWRNWLETVMLCTP